MLFLGLCEILKSELYIQALSPGCFSVFEFGFHKIFNFVPKITSKTYLCKLVLLPRSERDHSIANSSLFPTSLYLHSNSTQILALKKMVFLKKKIFPKEIYIFFYFFSIQLFSAEAMVFSKEF